VTEGLRGAGKPALAENEGEAYDIILQDGTHKVRLRGLRRSLPRAAHADLLPGVNWRPPRTRQIKCLLSMHLNPAVRRGEYRDRVVRITSFAVVIDEAVFPAHVAAVITGLADEGPAPADLPRVRPRRQLSWLAGARVPR